MILSRREAHFYIILGLSCALPLVFLVGLVWRPSIPTGNDSADELFAAANFAAPEAAGDDLSETLSVGSVIVRIGLTETADDNQSLSLQPTEPLQFSDVLVYWTAGEATPEGINAEAILLGQLAGTSRRVLPVPTAAQEQPGHLVFYSRGQDTLIATAPVPPGLIPE